MADGCRVDVIMGGPGHEAAVSRQSGAAIVAALGRAGCDVQAVDITQRLDPAALRADSVVFPIVHGTYGEDGTLQAELEAAGRTYVGSDSAASRLCMDKEATRERLRAHDIAVPWGVAFDPRQLFDHRSLHPPYQVGFVLKPRHDGSSVGVRLLASTSFLLPALEEIVAELGPVPMLLEERLPGPEYTVGVIDDPDGGARALVPLRIVPAAEFYDYHAKYEADTTRYEAVAEPELVARLHDLALRCYRACGCRDLARIDLMADRDGAPRVLEINTLPGFTSHSLLPKAAAAEGLDFAGLCRLLVASAERRLGLEQA